MDLINTHLATAALNPKYERSIQAALAIGKKLLNKYYDMSDHSELYRIAMGMSIHHWNPFLPLINRVFLVLHPSHKLEYFRTAKWEDDWVKAVEDIVRAEFERTYMDMDSDDSEVQHVRRIVAFFCSFKLSTFSRKLLGGR